MQTTQQHQEAPTPESGGPWLEDLGELPPRPRRRLLAPAPLALLGVLLLACGFIGGVLVEKGQGGGTSGSAPSGAFASGLRGLAGAPGAGASRSGLGAAASAGTGSGAAAAGRPTSGTVSFSSRGTLYVSNSEGNTVKVRTSAGTSVTRTVKSSVRSIRPGETVSVSGTTATDGTVTAEAVRVGTTGLASLFGAAGGSGSSATSGSGASGSSTATPPLFGG